MILEMSGNLTSTYIAYGLQMRVSRHKEFRKLCDSRLTPSNMGDRMSNFQTHLPPVGCSPFYKR